MEYNIGRKRGRSEEEDKNRGGWGVKDTCWRDESYHWTPIHTLNSWQQQPQPMAKRQHTQTSSVCSKSSIFTHSSADKARHLHGCLISLCVRQTNHPYTNAHTHTLWGKGVAAESWVIYRCTSSERGRQREGVQEKKEREKARSKERSELTGQVNHLILHALFTHTQLHRQLKLRVVNAADFHLFFY